MRTQVITAPNLPRLWEGALLACWEQGKDLPQEDGEGCYRGVPLLLEIDDLFTEPRYSKIPLCLPGDLLGYIDEVVKGSKDHLIDLDDPNKWHYTYHQRLRRYPVPVTLGECVLIDQLPLLLERLKVCPSSRRAQAITWQPWYDPQEKHPPCLQRIWFQIEEGKLVMHTHWRSRELVLAAYMNICALRVLQAQLAEQLGVSVGRYVDVTDSAHIYEKDFPRVAELATLLREPSLLDEEDYAQWEQRQVFSTMTEAQFQHYWETQQELSHA